MSVITGFHYITFLISVVVKGKVHPKMKILPSFSQPSFFQTSVFICSAEQSLYPLTIRTYSLINDADCQFSAGIKHVK